jgi:hypothetical protein
VRQNLWTGGVRRLSEDNSDLGTDLVSCLHNQSHEAGYGLEVTAEEVEESNIQSNRNLECWTNTDDGLC